MTQDTSKPESIRNTWLDEGTRNNLEAVLTHVSCGLSGGVERGHVKLDQTHVLESSRKDYAEVRSTYILPPDGEHDTSTVKVTSTFHLYKDSRQAIFKGIDVSVNYTVDPLPKSQWEEWMGDYIPDTGERSVKMHIHSAFIHSNLRDELEQWAWIGFNRRSLSRVDEVVKALNISV